ncbi:MAG: hypothetical protein ACLRM9_05655 [Collinsella aerofaciens]
MIGTMNVAPAAEFADVVTEVFGQRGRATASLQRGEVGGDVAKQRGVEGRLNDRGPWMPMNQNSGIMNQMRARPA